MSETRQQAGPQLERYENTWRLSRSRWAWEFLRRNPAFLENASRHGPGEISRRTACRGITLLRPRVDQMEAERWGLAFFPDVNEDGFRADVFWSEALYPRMVSVHVRPRGEEAACDIFEQATQVCDVVHLTDRRGREHLLLRGNGCVMQVRCEGHSFLGPVPVRMQIIFDGIGQLNTGGSILAKAAAFRDRRPVTRPLWTRASRARCHALIALDCHLAGLSHFDCACIIYGQERARREWGDPGGAMKAEMKRALKKGLHYCNGGYVELLGGQGVLQHAA